MNNNNKLWLEIQDTFISNRKINDQIDELKVLLRDYVDRITLNIKFVGTFDQTKYLDSTINFKNLWENINLLLVDLPDRFSIRFNIVVNIFTLSVIHDTINLIYGLRTLYSTNTQRIHLNFIIDLTETLDIQIVPDLYTDLLESAWAFMMKKIVTPEEPFKGFYDYELSELDSIIDYMKKGQNLDKEYVIQRQIEFFNYIENWDKKNNTNFIATYPALVDFFELCERNAKNER